ncbi:MAG: ribosome-binding factor [Fusobacteriaceae bacterium]|jgi:ribosome-binding factor A|nr:ribosome-binding factor [Fusobacteriales bacterium]MDN5303148.1 ribosome-binding factor [Fusobacteriaceae bacterium]
MNQKRKAIIEKEIMKVISNLLFLEIKNPKIKEGMISVTKVDVSNDMRYADVYFSILPYKGEEVDNDKILQGLNEVRSFMRKRVGEEINLRYTPEIRVHIDDTISYGVKISKLINDLK